MGMRMNTVAMHRWLGHSVAEGEMSGVMQYAPNREMSKILK
jgi:hypothetical protein